MPYLGRNFDRFMRSLGWVALVILAVGAAIPVVARIARTFLSP